MLISEPFDLTFLATSLAVLVFVMLAAEPAGAQVPPSAGERAGYSGLHAAAAAGDMARLRALLADQADFKARDSRGRTPLHVAAYGSHDDAVRLLIEAGAEANALEVDRYDIVTIAAVANDLALMKLALSLGSNAANVTSPYDGTALIAAAHLGHVEVVQALIQAKAPLDHINNLGWTALLEAVILGDGGPRHRAVVELLLEAGAKPKLADRAGATALDHALARGFQEMAKILAAASPG